MKTNRLAVKDAEALRQAREAIDAAARHLMSLRPVTRRCAQIPILAFLLESAAEQAKALHAATHFDATGELLPEEK